MDGYQLLSNTRRLRRVIIRASLLLACIGVLLSTDTAFGADLAPPQKDWLPGVVRAVALIAGSLAIALFAVMALVVVRAFLRAVEDKGDSIGIHSNWGGFGGGLGGWSFSRALSLLLAIVLLGSITYGLTEAVMKGINPRAAETPSTQPPRSTTGTKPGEGGKEQPRGAEKKGTEKKGAEQKAGEQTSGDSSNEQKTPDDTSSGEQRAN